MDRHAVNCWAKELQPDRNMSFIDWIICLVADQILRGVQAFNADVQTLEPFIRSQLQHYAFLLIIDDNEMTVSIASRRTSWSINNSKSYIVCNLRATWLHRATVTVLVIFICNKDSDMLVAPS
jgi:hypothetical protein